MGALHPSSAFLFLVFLSLWTKLGPPSPLSAHANSDISTVSAVITRSQFNLAAETPPASQPGWSWSSERQLDGATAHPVTPCFHVWELLNHFIFPLLLPTSPTFHWQPQSLEKILLAKQVPAEFKQGFCPLGFYISLWTWRGCCRSH